MATCFAFLSRTGDDLERWKRGLTSWKIVMILWITKANQWLSLNSCVVERVISTAVFDGLQDQECEHNYLKGVSKQYSAADNLAFDE